MVNITAADPAITCDLYVTLLDQINTLWKPLMSNNC